MNIETHVPKASATIAKLTNPMLTALLDLRLGPLYRFNGVKNWQCMHRWRRQLVIKGDKPPTFSGTTISSLENFKLINIEYSTKDHRVGTAKATLNQLGDTCAYLLSKNIAETRI